MRISDWSSDVCSSDLQRTASCPRGKARKWIGRSQPSCQVSDKIAVRFERRKGRNRLGVRFRPKSFRIDQFSPPNAVSYWLLLKLTMPARACAADPKNCPLTSPLLARVAVVLGLVAVAVPKPAIADPKMSAVPISILRA